MNLLPTPRAKIKAPIQDVVGKALLRRTAELRDLGPQLCIPYLAALESRL
jgi:hypothetical protein